MLMLMLCKSSYARLTPEVLQNMSYATTRSKIIIEAIVVPYNLQSHLIFMNEPIKCERCLDALNMSLARMYAMPINFYLGLLEGEACHISGGSSTYI